MHAARPLRLALRWRFTHQRFQLLVCLPELQLQRTVLLKRLIASCGPMDMVCFEVRTRNRPLAPPAAPSSANSSGGTSSGSRYRATYARFFKLLNLDSK